MKIEKLPSGSYRVRKTIDKKTYTFIFENKPTQKEILKEIQSINTNANLPQKGTFKDYANKYISIKEEVLSPSTIRSYYTIVRGLSNEFLSKQLKSITAADVQAEINQLAVTKAAKTVKNYHGFISAVMDLYNPCLQLRTTLPQKEKKEVYIPTDEEVKAVLNECKGKSYELAIRLGIYGMRRSEVCAVTSDDLNGNMLSINKALVQNKENKFVLKPYGKTTSSNRTIYIDDYAAQLLKEQGKGFNGYPNRILDDLHSIQDKLKLNRFKYHSLRHYYASIAHSLGVPDSYIMEAGGWASDNVLKTVYRHAQKDKNEDMMKFTAEYIQEQIIN